MADILGPNSATFGPKAARPNFQKEPKILTLRGHVARPLAKASQALAKASQDNPRRAQILTLREHFHIIFLPSRTRNPSLPFYLLPPAPKVQGLSPPAPKAQGLSPPAPKAQGLSHPDRKIPQILTLRGHFHKILTLRGISPTKFSKGAKNPYLTRPCSR